jgi:hypothetical protein
MEKLRTKYGAAALVEEAAGAADAGHAGGGQQDSYGRQNQPGPPHWPTLTNGHCTVRGNCEIK